MKIPLVADLTKKISKDYGVLKEDDGIAYRWGCVCQRCYNDHWPGVVTSASVCQRSVCDRRQGRPEADHHQWPARGPLGGRDAAPGPGLPVHWQKRRRWGKSPEATLIWMIYIPWRGFRCTSGSSPTAASGFACSYRACLFQTFICSFTLPGVYACFSFPSTVRAKFRGCCLLVWRTFPFPSSSVPRWLEAWERHHHPRCGEEQNFLLQAKLKRMKSFTAFLTPALAFMQEVFTWSSIVQSNMLNPLISVFSR